MKTVAAVFKDRDSALDAVERLRHDDTIEVSLLTPDDSEAAVSRVPTADAEQPGVAPAIGAVVGGGAGANLGVSATIVLPGVGTVLAAGYAAMALFGVAGAVTGALIGKTLQKKLEGELPKDEIFVYEDALRRGRSVVIAMAGNDGADGARRIFDQTGAESINAAREEWWIGLRDAEEEEYRAGGGDFESDESLYRKGFESALQRELEGLSYEEARRTLVRLDLEGCDTPPFRCGYERGRQYAKTLRSETRKT